MVDLKNHFCVQEDQSVATGHLVPLRSLAAALDIRDESCLDFLFELEGKRTSRGQSSHRLKL